MPLRLVVAIDDDEDQGHVVIDPATRLAASGGGDGSRRRGAGGVRRRTGWHGVQARSPCHSLPATLVPAAIVRAGEEDPGVRVRRGMGVITPRATFRRHRHCYEWCVRNQTLSRLCPQTQLLRTLS
jgi:hypothetical protein